MEIDLTPEVSGRGAGASPVRHRQLIIVVVVLTVGLVVGVLVGAAFSRQPASGGTVVFTGADLQEAGRAVTLRWSLANFSSGVARVDSVLVNGRPSAVGASNIPGRSVAEFATPLECGTDSPPQLSIVVVDGDEEISEVGYLVERLDWARLCG